MLSGYNAWFKWRQIKDDKIKIDLINKLMRGDIKTKQWNQITGNAYMDWLCKEEVSSNLDMQGQPWQDVVKAYPTLTTKDMMTRYVIGFFCMLA